MNAFRFTSAVSAGLLGLALLASQAMAQNVDPQRADAALQAARSLENQIATYGVTREATLEVVRLHMESVEARAQNDPLAAISLRDAGLYLATVNAARGADLLKEAAERALSIGDVELAAHAFLDAANALTANGSKSVNETEAAMLFDWVHQATLLANSPLLDSTQKGLILRRVALDGQFAG